MIALLTYDAPHRKTQDVAFQLMLGRLEFRVIAVPWVDRKPRRFIYAHRPAEMMWPCDPWTDNAHFFDALNIPYGVCPPDTLHAALEEAGPSVVVVGGAGILPREIVEDFKVLNVHPGLLPACRGLDTLKWSIIEKRRVGVTAHICDEYTDLGWKVLEREVPLYPSDTFHSFAMRQYECETALFLPAIRCISGHDRQDFEHVDKRDTVATRRMPKKIEAGLLPAFEEYKLVFVRQKA